MATGGAPGASPTAAIPLPTAAFGLAYRFIDLMAHLGYSCVFPRLRPPWLSGLPRLNRQAWREAPLRIAA